MPPINRVILSGNEAFLKAAIAKELADYQKLKNLEVEGSGGGSIDGFFTALPDESVQIYPQAQLWFYESPITAKANDRAYHPLSVHMSFRIKDENWNTTKAQALALKIKNEFAKPIYYFDTGKFKVTYKDKVKGQLFILPLPNKDAAKPILGKLFDLFEGSPDWDNLTFSGTDKVFPATGERVRAFGEIIKKHSNRSGVTVYFRHAVALVPNLPNSVPLVDTMRKMHKAYFHEPNPYLDLPRAAVTSKNPNTPLTSA